MKLTVTENGTRLTLFIAGELDHHAARALMREIERKIEEAVPRDCVLDMQGVSFMDSSGIALILKTYRRMKELGGRFWVDNVPPQPLRVLDTSGIDRIIGITALK